MDFEDAGYDGVIEPGMTLCVESYIGEEGGDEGVKLEQQLPDHRPRAELLTSLPVRGQPARRVRLVSARLLL